MISVPPTNSLLTYSCGIVCQSEYSLIPSSICQLCLPCTASRFPRASDASATDLYPPDRKSSSSNTLNAVNFCGLTPCRPRIWIAALENPHCGVSGVPFMNRTTAAEATALSMALRVSVVRKDFCKAANREERRGLRFGRRAWEATWT